MLQTLKNAWNTKDIRGKILFTLFILLIYRLGSVIPVPFVNANAIVGAFDGTILQYMDTLSGGALSQASLFALGVQPYINASIIIQLLAVVFPKLGEMAKDDKEKMNFITRILTVALAIVTGWGYYAILSSNHALTNAATKSDNPGLYWFYGIVIVACFVAGASLVMWIAERINERGIGNGISIILFANIVSSVPSFCYKLAAFTIDTYSFAAEQWIYPTLATVFSVALIAFLIALIVVVIWFTGSERRIPIQYAKKVVGRKMYGGQSSNLPIKLNMTGVMPIIFASSIVSLLPTILALCKVDGSKDTFWDKVYNFFGTSGVVYPVLLFVLILGFTYFYTMITFDPVEISNNLKKQGGAIPGIRQGRPTSDYIKKILNKVNLVGALFLGVIAVLPIILAPHVIQHFISWVMKAPYDPTDIYYSLSIAYYVDPYVSGLTSTLTFGGTTLLIVVGVAIETFRELEAQLTMRNYKGFLG